MSQYSHLSEPDPELPGSIPRIGGPGPLTEDMIPAMRQALDVPLNQRLDVYKTRLPSDSAYKLEDHTVAVEGGEIIVRTVSPILAGGENGPLPVLVYFHGGGWAFGGLDTNDFDLRILSVELRLVIINVDYRLAPEHHFPTGLNDCYAALKWTVENARKIGGSTEKGFLVCGASSGANLAAAVAHRSLKDPFFENHKVTGQILQIPALVHPAAYPPEYASELLSYEQNKNAPILSKELMDFLYRLSPLLTDPTGLPPSYLQICGLDPLRDEGLLYKRLLREQGVLTKLDIYPGVPHGFHAILPGMRAAKKWEEDLRQGIKWVFNSSV
ncbi:Abhydrolase-3 domain-containing protein [Mycena venus]|uniref:Abhydrolase-3 domain-containing protein n=1 Tax=Mycena venus TaxID=2733690 RepID=A0A8H6X2M2_9AGAR|nr:Abhydrolase-3 domain-containing protein [Mycena venus]